MLVKRSLNLIDGDIYTVFFAGILLIVSISPAKMIPPLIPILLLRIVFSLKGIELSTIGPVALRPVIPDVDSLWKGFTILVVPRIALTFGNAIVLTDATGKLLYGRRAERLNLKSIPNIYGYSPDSCYSGIYNKQSDRWVSSENRSLLKPGQD